MEKFIIQLIVNFIMKMEDKSTAKTILEAIIKWANLVLTNAQDIINGQPLPAIDGNVPGWLQGIVKILEAELSTITEVQKIEAIINPIIADLTPIVQQLETDLGQAQ